MEINHYGDTVMPVVAQENTVEGRMVLLTTNVHSRNYGSQTDLPGVKLPDTAAEAARARYILKFEQDNRTLPIYQPNPSYSNALRYGFDQDANAPFSATVYLTHPGVQDAQTIPSGAGCVAYGEGIYTVTSGNYVYSANIETPGNPLQVCNTAEDSESTSGKLKYGNTNPVAEVYRYDSSTGDLEFKILH